VRFIYNSFESRSSCDISAQDLEAKFFFLVATPKPLAVYQCGKSHLHQPFRNKAPLPKIGWSPFWSRYPSEDYNSRDPFLPTNRHWKFTKAISEQNGSLAKEATCERILRTSSLILALYRKEQTARGELTIRASRLASFVCAGSKRARFTVRSFDSAILRWRRSRAQKISWVIHRKHCSPPPSRSSWFPVTCSRIIFRSNYIAWETRKAEKRRSIFKPLNFARKSLQNYEWQWKSLKSICIELKISRVSDNRNRMQLFPGISNFAILYYKIFSKFRIVPRSHVTLHDLFEWHS